MPSPLSSSSFLARRARARRAAVALLAVQALAACAGAPTGPRAGAGGPLRTDTTPPALRREFRGVWIATVGNIDWPSRSGLAPEAQQAELRALLDRAAAARLNAVVLQVRPASDAVYRSALEPWASMLTGRQGGDPGWDPLDFAVREAHARGMELHAWFNPYRAGNARDSLAFAPHHVFHARRDLVRLYGPQVWMDPGEPDVLRRTLDVVADVVRRYDVDGVHVDDYFYPYPQRDSLGRPRVFPDSATYARYRAGGGTLARDDWRRENVDRFVRAFAGEVHARKPWVKVGVSPFGVWRPNTPPGIQGLDAYAALYADARRWLVEGWVDYLAPQLYWAVDPPAQSYPVLLAWWVEQNARGRHVWPGNAAYRVADQSAWPVAELVRQAELTRAQRGAGGNIWYNGKSTLNWSGGAVAQALAAALYQDAAVIPPSPWLDAAAPAAPTLAVTESSAGARAWTLRVTVSPADSVRWLAVRARAGGAWLPTRVVPADSAALVFGADAGRLERVLVTAVDRAGNASAAADWRAR
jgi:uncharacterized lipoprotein YddW (UPF0748 family)